MSEREQALKRALEDGINVLKERFGDDYDRALVTQNIPLLLSVMWPHIEAYNERYAMNNFEEQFQKRFPNHVLTDYGPTVFDYIVGNVQTAVANEIILMMETWLQTMADAQSFPKFTHHTPDRDWAVAESHTKELISEVKQYRTRGVKGHGAHSIHTGSIDIQKDNSG